MKFYIKKERVFKLLSKLNSYVGSSLKNPVINNIYLKLKDNVLYLIVTNLEVEIRYHLNIYKKDIFKNGILTVNIRKLYELFRTYSNKENILFDFYGNRLKIVYLKSISYLSTIDYKKFPVFNKNFLFKFEFCVSNIILKKIIKLIYFSVGDQNVYHYLNGVFIEFINNNFFFVTTDGYRISIYNLPIKYVGLNIKKNFFFIISYKLIMELFKLLDFFDKKDVVFQVNENMIKIIYGEFIIYSSLINGNFPDYKNIISVVKFYKFIDIDIINLKNVLLRSSAISGCCLNHITFCFKNELLLVYSSDLNNNEVKEEIIVDNVNNLSLKISFNIKYILDIINSIEDSNKIRFFFKDYNSIIKIIDLNNKYIKYMIMPVVL